MPLLDAIRAGKLVELARQRFAPELTDAEIKLLRDSAASNDLGYPDDKAPKPEVRGELLRWLLTDLLAVELIDPKGLRARCVTVTGDLDLRQCVVTVPIDCWGCVFRGQVNLDSARTFDIYLTGGRLDKGFSAAQAVIAGALSLTYLTSVGCVSIPSARVHAMLDFSGSCLLEENEALAAYDCTIGGGIRLMSGFYSSGTVALYKTAVGGFLDCSGADLGNLSIHNAKVESDIILYGLKTSSRLWIDLTGAKVKRLHDDRESWPRKNSLLLDGLVYDEIVLHQKPTQKQLDGNDLPDEIAITANQRVEWILLQKEEDILKPQPWIQLHDALVAKGDDDEAKHVLYRLQCTRAARCSTPGRWWQSSYAWLQESPLRILYSITLVVLLGWIIFGIGAAVGAMAPTDKDAYAIWASRHSLSTGYPRLNPFIYSLENALPLVKLGQDDKWAPDPNSPGKGSMVCYTFLVWSRWILILAGWLQATVLAAALSERFKE